MCEKYDEGRVKRMIIVNDDNHDGENENMMPFKHDD